MNRRKNRKLNIAKFVILILVVLMVVGGGYFVLNNMNGHDKYASYNEYNEDNKSFGKVAHYKEETKNFYVSLYYPKTTNKQLNKIIKEKYQAYLDEANKKKQVRIDVLYMDYNIDKVFNQYVTVKLDFKRIDVESNEDPKTLTNEKDSFVYDLNNNNVLTIKDCLRNNYASIISKNNGTNLDGNSTLLALKQKSLMVYNDNSITKGANVVYKDNKESMKLANKKIPSSLPAKVIMPEKQKDLDPKGKMIAITMDDGPHATLTKRAMAAFDKYNGKATFFELGENIKKYPSVVKDAYKRGFEIANHSYDHSQLTKLDEPSLIKQIEDTQNACFNLVGDEPTLIRPPYGASNDSVRTQEKNHGLTQVLWDVDTLDWKHRDPNYVKDQIVNQAGDGKIVLIHDIHETSIAGLELALPILHDQGYQFVTVSTLYKYKK